MPNKCRLRLCAQTNSDIQWLSDPTTGTIAVNGAAGGISHGDLDHMTFRVNIICHSQGFCDNKTHSTFPLILLGRAAVSTRGIVVSPPVVVVALGID